jgi:hypothetical protein
MNTEILSLKYATKSVLKDISKHAHTLATGLQNAAPPQESGPGKSILYLAEIAIELEAISREVDGQHSSDQ